MAGQGTIALEMLAVQPDLEVLVVPIGGGGIIAGMAVAAKGVNPAIEVFGAETTRFPSMYCAVRGLAPEFGATTIADGIAVKEPGNLTHCGGARAGQRDPAGGRGRHRAGDRAAAGDREDRGRGRRRSGLAAVLAHGERFQGRKVGLVLCGGNIDPLMLADIIERGMVRTGRLTRLTVELRDLPGALAKVTACLAEQNANIEEISHQRAFTSLPVQSVEVDFVLETRDHDHVQQVIAALAAAGFVARLHND